MEEDYGMNKLLQLCKKDEDLAEFTYKLLDENLPMEEIICRFIEDYNDTFTDELLKFILKASKKLIQEGNYDVANEVGAMYYRGERVLQDYKKAMHYYKIAADHNNFTAISNLGYCYYYGRCGKQDYDKAYDCFAFLAAMDDIKAVYKLADMYKNGYHVEKDEKKAFILYNKASNLLSNQENQLAEGRGSVFYRLGNCLQNGIGCDIELKEALFYYNLAELDLYTVVYEQNNPMYKKTYQDCLKQQEMTRKKLQASIIND